MKRFVTVFVFNEKGQFALLDNPVMKAWLPPGGKANYDEPYYHAAIREVKEELGVEVVFIEDSIFPNKKPDNRALIHPQPIQVQYLDIEGKEDAENAVYIAMALDNNLKSERGKETKWFDLEEALKLNTFDNVKDLMSVIHEIIIKKLIIEQKHKGSNSDIACKTSILTSRAFTYYKGVI